MLKNPVFAALDVDDYDQALTLANSIKDNVGGFKIGPRLCNKYGEKIVKDLSALAPVFVDLKFYDIPNTMLASVEQVFNAGASFTTIHASCGKEALFKLAQLETDLSQKRPFKIFAVTILTSFEGSTMPSTQCEKSISEQVKLLAQDCFEAGITSLVCSSEEVADLKKLNSDSFLVTPGIRLSDKTVANDDQKRVTTPVDALMLGASALVIGRPIYAAKNPEQVSKEIYQSISEYL